MSMTVNFCANNVDCSGHVACPSSAGVGGGASAIAMGR
ncbi:hypothetical protein BZL29_3500 [Mycobacterium kansasii]|uniref:Uncharacterized protein n=1 Tax=Mycobacterium kansasii TaxID=1768 RepID=A0A1V3XDI4_MYCKA|nr:hypothetical protein BZL29_3500 [Mycobacterium kansasii]